MLALRRAMSEGDEETGQPAEQQVRGDSEELRAFAGLADLDEDLSTMHQSNAEVERWRRLSTRGLTPATGSAREGGLDAPIVDLDATTSEMDAHAATTAPGTIAAPLPRAPMEPDTGSADATRKLPSVRPPALDHDGGADATRKLPSVHPPAGRDDETPPGGSADATRKLPSVRPELAHETVRRSFAAPRDGDSAPPGSRVVLPRSSAPPGRISSRPVKVPRPSAPPPDPSEVRGWRPSDPSETDEAVDPVVIPKPAPLPGAHRASQVRSEPPAQATSSRPAPAPLAAPSASTPAERPSLESAVEVSGALLAVVVLVGLLVFFGLVFLLFL